jgi:transposase
MYLEVQNLKEIGLNVSQIARKLGVCRNTVYKYLDASPEEIRQVIKRGECRRKKLDDYRKEIIGWLREYPDLSSAQIYDWLLERHPEIEICEGTVRNYVQMLRKELDIPKVQAERTREYEVVEDPPMGYQVQVDFGEKKLYDPYGQPVKVWCIAFVFSHSRYKYAEWRNRPFTTKDVINAHENAFAYFGGMPKELVYDQDRLVLVSENYGELIFTHEFAAYQKIRRFKVYMCRKGDPESKGRVEKTVDFLKRNFAHNRVFYTLDRLNEDCLAWLERTGNGKRHNTTKRVPAEVFTEERKHLLPITEKITTHMISTGSILHVVRKNNTVVYKSNRYSVPLGTYKGPDTQVWIQVENGSTLWVIDPETGEIIAQHLVSQEKGKLIKNTDHARNKSQKTAGLIAQATADLGGTAEAVEFLSQIRIAKPRYVRDQLHLITRKVTGVDPRTIDEVLRFCLQSRLFSATDFSDALEYFAAKHNLPGVKTTSTVEAVKPIEPVNASKWRVKPEIRNLSKYNLVP